MSSKLELLDLHDYILFEIIMQLDHESKKQLMATCKKFERLIGQTHQFYKNFKFRLDSHQIQQFELARLLNFHHSCKKIQRKFGCVEYTKFDASDWDLEMAMRVVPNAIKIQLGKLRISRFDFSKLMRSATKVRQLEIRDLEITDPFEDFEMLELPHLRRVEITDSMNLRAFTGLAPSSLKNLRLLGAWFDEDQPLWNTGLLAKQSGLDELSLECFDIYCFRFHPKNKHIKKLVLRDLCFLAPVALEKFKDFVKIQESVEELELHFDPDEVELKPLDHAGMLTHLLGLKSLKKLVIGCVYDNEIFAVLSKIQLCNPSVESLTIMNPDSGADLKSLPLFFPNVTHLKITWKSFRGLNDKYDHLEDFFDEFSMDLKPINSMKKVVEFEMDYLTDEMIGQLELKQLKVFRITEKLGLMDQLDPELFGMDPLSRWRTFIVNNAQLEVLDMEECKVPHEFLRIVLENFPLPRSLKLKLDGHNYGNLEVADHPEISKEDLARYVKEQAEILAILTEKKWDSLEEVILENVRSSMPIIRK
jgi:hypothetical protein